MTVVPTAQLLSVCKKEASKMLQLHTPAMAADVQRHGGSYKSPGDPKTHPTQGLGIMTGLAQTLSSSWVPSLMPFAEGSFRAI